MIISFVSFAGGAGKTTLAVELARTLALKEKSVLVLDTDISCPGLGLNLELEEENYNYTFNDYLVGEAKPKDVLYDITERLHLDKGIVHIVPMYAKHTIIAKTIQKGVDTEKMHDIIEYFKNEYDYIILDTHSGVIASALISAQQSDLMLIVAGVKNKDYMGTLAYTRIARKLDVPSLILVNKLLPSMDKDEWTKKYEDLTGETVIGRIPLSDHFLDHMGVDTFTKKHDNHDFREAIQRLVKRLEVLDEKLKDEYYGIK